MKRKINIMNPLQGRKWLKQFVSDDLSMIRFKPNLTLSKSYLGFSANTNRFGLRGPDSIEADGVIGGTSFAMGMTVDNNCNWYDLILRKKDWINFGLPVGIEQQRKLIDTYYKGSGKVLLYVYHPNIWHLGLRYNRISPKSDVIQQLGWETSLIKSYKLFIKYHLKSWIKRKRGELLKVEYMKKKYTINTKYFYFDFDQNAIFFKRQVEQLKSVFATFAKVIVVRVPVKEQCVQVESPRLQKLQINYDECWNSFIADTKECKNVISEDLTKGIFALDDFHPLDNHWNSDGNQKFAKVIKKILSDHGQKKYLQ